MNFAHIKIVYRKEMTDILRDRRTLISMIVVPMLVIPGLMFGMGRLTMSIVNKASSEMASIMILGRDHAPDISRRIHNSPLLKVVEPADDFAEQIENKTLRAAVEFPENFEEKLKAEAGDELTVSTYYYDGEIRSEFARRALRQVLNSYRDELVEKRLKERDLDPSLLTPFENNIQNVASDEAVQGAKFGGIIPYIIILLTLTGAMYPAIDLTAGEKERGTIETILASPVSRSALATGKFATVFTVSLCTALLALISLAISSHFFSGTQEGAVASGAGLSLAMNPKSIAAMLLMVLPICVMFSSALLAIALQAKSYKEAQSYISPLMIVVILPAMAAMLPGIEMSMKLAFVPILNVSLISKELLAGKYEWHWIGLIFLSSCVYASIALAIAGKSFQRESVLFRT